jgi:hypothetical protein
MTKTQKSKLTITFISILASIFIYSGSMIVYLYANGWRLDPFNQQVIKTGVITVESDPFLATVYIDGVSKGRTPRSTSLPVGTYDVSVYRNGYREWRKQVNVKEEVSTPVFPWLIKEEIEKTNIYTTEDKRFVNSWINENHDHVLILLSTYNQDTQSYLYELLRYDVNTTFWDLSPNPKVVLTFETTVQPEIAIDLSPGGILGVLKYTENEITTNYLLNTSKAMDLKDLSTLNISPFEKYTMSWSRNNQYLMFESTSDLISFNLEKQTRYLLLRKIEDKKYIWSTDEQGYFYLVEPNEDINNEQVFAYKLIQEEMDGSNLKTLIADLFFQKNIDYLTKYKEEKELGKYAPFTNSTISTKSVGEIKNIRVNQIAQGIYIQTENASYWYNIKTKKYNLISPYTSELVQFSTDNKKLIYKDSTKYGVFTFTKENGNPTIEIGSKTIKELSTAEGKVSNVRWLSNSLYISFIEDNNLYISDQDGDNKTVVLEDISKFKHLGINSSRDRIFTVSTEQTEKEVLNIDRYNIH